MKILSYFTLAGITFLGIFLASCQHEPELIPGTPAVCFDSQVLPIIKTSCAMEGCHTGGGHLFGLTTYDEIYSRVTPGKPMKSNLHQVMIGNPNSQNYMPPKSKATLSSAQIDIISLWILQGAPNTICDTIPCDSLNVTFSGTILPITNTYCVGCHGGANPKGSLSLTDYTSIKASVDGGRFMGSVEHLTGYKAMPQGSEILSDCKIAQLKKWINDGMPNN
ncbi:MAG: hypothetical protein WCR72_08215 [Bacteroidota bacterium]